VSPIEVISCLYQDNAHFAGQVEGGCWIKFVEQAIASGQGSSSLK